MTELVGPRLYSCCNCRNHVALQDNVISKAFQRRSGSSRSNPSLKSWRGLLRQLRSSRLSGPDIFDRPIRLMKNSYAHIIIKIINHFNITCFVPHGINPLRLRDMLMQLENVIGDVSWLTILLSYVNSEDMDWSQLNHVSREPLLFLIWEKIALLADTRNSFQVRSEAAATLGEISRHDCEHSIIEEGGVEPLLKFVGDGPIESQENAIRTLGSPGHAWESVERVILADVCKVCAIILREGPMKVQAAVAWAVSEIAARHPKCRDVFVRHDVVYWLLSHLAFETVEVDSNHATSKTNSNVNGNENPATKAEMKAMATRALAKLAKGNSAIITAVAEEDAELRTSALYRNSPARKSIVDQLVIKITDEKEDPELLIPCIKAVGNLATTFEATDTRMIVDPLLRLLHETNNFVTKNACIALTKFACTSNYFHVEVSKAIIIAGAATQLIRLFYFGHWNVQLHALVLICYIAIHVPGSEELAQAKVLAVLKWAPKHHYFTDHEKLNKLFYAALDVPENEVAEAEACVHATYGWELQRSYMTPAETLYTLLHKATSTSDLYHFQSSKRC
ncbi:hypothetical protein ACFX1T_026950 [Malus domestica]